MVIKRGPRNPPKEVPMNFKHTLRINERRYTRRAEKNSRNSGVHGYISAMYIREDHPANDAETIIAIAIDLQKHGINTPRVTHRVSQLFATENAGADMHDVLLRLLNRPILNRQRVKFLLSAAARQLGKMHSLEYSHHNSHFRNFVVKGSKVSIIDFKYTKKGKVNWNDPDNIYKHFWLDYAFLKTEFKNIINEQHEMMEKTGKSVGDELTRVFNQHVDLPKFLEKVISRYPTTEQVKSDVFERIKRELSLNDY